MTEVEQAADEKGEGTTGQQESEADANDVFDPRQDAGDPCPVWFISGHLFPAVMLTSRVTMNNTKQLDRSGEASAIVASCY